MQFPPINTSVRNAHFFLLRIAPSQWYHYYVLACICPLLNTELGEKHFHSAVRSLLFGLHDNKSRFDTLMQLIAMQLLYPDLYSHYLIFDKRFIENVSWLLSPFHFCCKLLTRIKINPALHITHERCFKEFHIGSVHAKLWKEYI